MKHNRFFIPSFLPPILRNVTQCLLHPIILSPPGGNSTHPLSQPSIFSSDPGKCNQNPPLSPLHSLLPPFSSQLTMICSPGDLTSGKACSLVAFSEVDVEECDQCLYVVVPLHHQLERGGKRDVLRFDGVHVNFLFKQKNSKKGRVYTLTLQHFKSYHRDSF